MPGSHRIRSLGRSSSHRQALVKNLVTSLVQHESITTTLAKAKEAQRSVEKLITLGKRGSYAPKSTPLKGIAASTRARALSMIFSGDNGQSREHLIEDKVFGKFAQRYANRPGGYTRILHLENRIGDNSPQAILELVDGDKDMKRWLLARTVARLELQGLPLDPITAKNKLKITKFNSAGFQSLVETAKNTFYSSPKSLANLPRWAAADSSHSPAKISSNNSSSSQFQPKWKSRAKLANIFN